MSKPATALLALLAAGCAGYRTKFELPQHIRTFSVSTFTNKTLERNLDFEFTQALIREIEAKTPLRVAPPEEADLVISGEIDDFDRRSLRRRDRGLKSEMRLRLYVNVAMFDRKKVRMFFEGREITRRAEFAMNRGETFRQAREEVVRELARRVVSRAFEVWPQPEPQEAQARGG
ncbi:MAG: LPS assembly lipoprotein LptE [bacterium]